MRAEADRHDESAADGRMVGHPPSSESQVTLSNWQDPPNQRWAFRHMRELLPSHVIRAGSAARDFVAAPAALGGLPVSRFDGSTGTVGDVIADTWTDALVVLHDGRLVDERYLHGMEPTTRHLLMSVSKSFVGVVAGILVERGLVDPAAAVSNYVAEVGGSGYAGASVRDLLDMRTGVAFREEYTALDAEVRVMERSMGWRPIKSGDPVGAYDYLTTIGTGGPHGGDFTYRSADTDMLGWVCERASGERMARLLSTLIWQPMGATHDAEITCDAVGSAIHDGGMSCTAMDLARFGQLLLEDGIAAGVQVAPTSWIDDARQPPADVRAAFFRSVNEIQFPGGWYRSQFWLTPGPAGPVLMCIGIHGQLVYVNWAQRTVAVKQSSWPDAQHPAHLVDTIRSMSVISAHLSGR